MDQLYPLKFKPILKERIWGGSRLKEIFGKKSSIEKCGESWELSAVQGEVSVVTNGFLKDNSLEEIIEIYMGDLVGEKVYDLFGMEFPLLIKFIDANDNLSIQVHPNDDLALQRHDSYGKTEMWYVMESKPGAQLISGFNKPVSKEEYLQSVENNTLESILNKVDVISGDSFFIPAGRVHAIGAGILLAEIQQTSDVTYRIYDYNRKDANSKTRELHTDLAVDAIDYSFEKNVKTSYSDIPNQPVKLASCVYFTTQKIVLTKAIIRDFSNLDSFVIYICCSGKLNIQYEGNEKLSVVAGETVLIPALIAEIALIPEENCVLLEVFIE
jgi:mannose-6-phosphate isomerase